MTFKPLLAPGEDPLRYPDYFKKLQYPLLCSPKLDGIRCIIKSGVALSRTGKMLPSFQVQSEFTKIAHFDGELIEGNQTDFDVYNRTQSHVMSENKPGDLKFFVFDYTSPELLSMPFYQRLESVENVISNTTGLNNVKFLEHTYVDNLNELLEFEQKCLNEGYEGIMLRNPIAHYKQGRATFRENIIYKLKRFQDAEGVIVDFEEQMHNTNKLEKDELGYAKRSYKKEGMVPFGQVGNFVILYGGEEILVAPGSFNHDERKEIWNNKEKYKGSVLKFRYFSHGIKDKPRFPRALGLRSEMDL